MGNNNLNGTIPSEFGKLANLRVVELSGNALEGRVPSEAGQMKTLGMAVKHVLVCQCLSRFAAIHRILLVFLTLHTLSSGAWYSRESAYRSDTTRDRATTNAR